MPLFVQQYNNGHRRSRSRPGHPPRVRIGACGTDKGVCSHQYPASSLLMCQFPGAKWQCCLNSCQVRPKITLPPVRKKLEYFASFQWPRCNAAPLDCFSTKETHQTSPLLVTRGLIRSRCMKVVSSCTIKKDFQQILRRISQKLLTRKFI